MDALIARSRFFSNPDRTTVRLSPNGQFISFLAPLKGVLNLWIAPATSPDDARPLTQDSGRGVQTYHWMPGGQLIYAQDSEGDENWHLYSLNPSSGEVIDLTPIEGVAATVQAVSPRFPNELIIGINDRDPQLHDPHRVNVLTGARKRLFDNPGFIGFVFDFDLRPRYAASMDPTGAIQVFKSTGSGWEPDFLIPQEDTLTTHLLGFDAVGDALYLLDSRGRDTAALVRLHLKTDERIVLLADSRADIAEVLIHPKTGVFQGAAFTWERRVFQLIDADLEPDFKALAAVDDGELDVISRTLDDRHWIVAFSRDNGALRYYCWNRDTQRALYLFSNRSGLDGLELSSMHPQVITSRDGLKLVSYLSLPRWAGSSGRPDAPLPLVLLVHGGPWARDRWGYDPMHQWLSNRGYAVLSVNFRGSTGFGKAFVNAGNLEWGAKMHDDLLDAIDWAVEEGIADPDRIGVMGGSYGGYAALAGLTVTPERFACAVDIVGPSNLITLLSTIPDYWKPLKKQFHTRVGNDETDEGRAFLASRSPLSHVDAITKPLLIGQGANDPRVKQSESDQIVAAMRLKKIPVQYALFSDEGHGFSRPENRFAFYSVVENFLAQHIGGRAEERGDAFAGSTIALS